MFSRLDMEHSLLLQVVREKNFDVLLENDITTDYFSDEGKRMYYYISEYLENYKDYMHINNLLQAFDIDLETYDFLLTLGPVNFCIDWLKAQHIRDVSVDRFNELHSNSKLINEKPLEFVNLFGRVNEELKDLVAEKKSVDLLADVYDVLQADENNVIKTGFKELDDKLIGWNKGEELVILMGRPRTRKINVRIKVCTFSSPTRF